MNEYRNQLWWNSHDCPFLVSMKEKFARVEIYQKSVKN